MQSQKSVRQTAGVVLVVLGLIVFGLGLAACGDETATALSYGTSTASAVAATAKAAPKITATVGTVAPAATPTPAATPDFTKLALTYPSATEVTLSADTAQKAASNFTAVQPGLAVSKTQTFVTTDALDKIATYYDAQFKSAGWTQIGKQSGAGSSFFEAYHSPTTGYVGLSAYPYDTNQPDEVVKVGKAGDNVIVLVQGAVNPVSAAATTAPGTSVAAGAATCTLGAPLPETSKTYFSIVLDKGGTISGELYPGIAPKTVAHITDLAAKGFYNGLTFHRVVPGFVIQGGDPKGDGSGGSGTTVPGEFTTKYKHQCGTVAMARSSDPNSGDSQFYILTAANAASLDGQYTIFGQVTSGMDVVFGVQQGDKMKSFTVSNTPIQ